MDLRTLADVSRTTDDTRRANDAVAAHQAALPHRTEMTVQRERALGPGGGAIPRPPASPRAVERTVGAVPVRVVAPTGRPVGTYLHLHGGGWATGSSAHQDAALVAMADAAHVTCVSVDYRLAPEHPFPAAVEDASSVLAWLGTRPAGIPVPDRVVVGGESAGAHLACLLALAARGPGVDVRGLNLVQGIYDLRLTAGARHHGRGGHVVDTPTIRHQVARFLAGADPDRPDVSPLLAPLHRPPPALFTAGTLDPLLEDSLLMATRWRAAGGDARLDVAPGGIHGFAALDCEIGRASLERQHAFVGEVLR